MTMPCSAGCPETYHKWPVTLPCLLVKLWKFVHPHTDNDHAVCVCVIIRVRLVKHKARRHLHQKLKSGMGFTKLYLASSMQIVWLK